MGLKKTKHNGKTIIPDRRNGGAILFDEQKYNAALSCLDEVDADFVKLAEVLRQYDYEVTDDTLFRLAFKGAPELCTITEEKFERWAESHEYPAFLIESGKRAAVEALPADLVAAVGEVATRFADTRRGVSPSIETDDLVFDQKKEILRIGDEYREKVRAACSVSFTDQDVADAEKLVEVLAQLRELDRRGYDALQFVRCFIGNRYADLSELPSINPAAILESMTRYPFKVLTAEAARADGPDRLAKAKVYQDIALRSITNN